MKLATAIRLIEKGISARQTETWADLGAGSGLFTQALSSCLKPQSTIYAIDKDLSALAKIKTDSLTSHVKKVNHDFVATKLDIELLDGILMANALHFVHDKQIFLRQLVQRLKPSGKMIIIEYEMTYGNQWVPYPINLSALQQLSTSIGYSLTKLDEEPSRYNNTTMYAAMLTSL